MSVVYNVHIPKIVKQDIQNVINRKREFGTYEKNIIAFINRIEDSIHLLSKSPLTGSNLNARIYRSTNIKYFIIDDYLLFYEVDYANVFVLRFLSAKSDWLSKLFT